MFFLPKIVLSIAVFAVIHITALAAFCVDVENHPGKAIYQKLCLECHGEQGEGVDDMDVDPLVGTRTLESLTGRIERTMPEDNEDACVGPDARSVAEYIYHAFYSVEAQARNKPVSRDVNRLTGPQYLNSVADLVGYFRNTSYPPELEKFGLQATYFADGYYKVDKEKKEADRFKRVDSHIRFDFGNGIPKVPEGKQFIPEQFGIQWTGGIMIEETGTYEFVVRTRNGAFLNVNSYDSNANTPKTIDAWVAPDNEIRDVKTKMFLLGGRIYPLRAHFFKYKADKAYIELLWKKPNGVLETIPNKVLTPDYSRSHFTSNVKFPADDRSYGYERGSNVSREWLDAVTQGAFELSNYVVENLNELAKTRPDKEDYESKLREFGAEFPSVAFRRPLKPEEKTIFVDKPFQEHGPTPDAIREIVLLSVTSPRFLYPDTAFDSPTGPWAKATALSMAMWDSIPNRHVRNAVEKGKMGHPGQLENLVWQMQWDGRARNKTREFFHHWLELDRAAAISKDSKLFPEFNDQVMADLRTSLEMFLNKTVWSEKSDYRELLLSQDLYLNQRLAPIYGKEGVKGGFQKVSFKNENRNGVITHPFLLTSFAYHNNTSPIHRGVFLTRNIAGMTLKPPPEAIEFKDNDFPPNLSMREKVTELTRAKACMACHSMINPLGFSLEHYDAIGRWREKEQNRPINDDGILETDAGERIEIFGPREVAEFAANSPSSHRAFVRQIFHHMVKQPSLAYGTNTIKDLENHFKNTGFSVRFLMVKIALAATQPIHPDS